MNDTTTTHDTTTPHDAAAHDACPAGGAACPVEAAIRAIGGKWSLLILRVLLLEGPTRYNRLLGRLEGISGKVLTGQLRMLSADGILDRREVSRSPRHVEYALTPAGAELMPIFRSLGDWHARHRATNGA